MTTHNVRDLAAALAEETGMQQSEAEMLVKDAMLPSVRYTANRARDLR